MSAGVIINQAQQAMRSYIMIVLTDWPILSLLHSFRHEDEGTLVLRTLGLVFQELG